MPELAEVEYYRRQWDAGIGHCVTRAALHAEKRVFRGSDPRELQRRLKGSRLRQSEARGKQMLFCFSGHNWLGLHLGMTGKLSIAAPDFRPGKHDHLVLYQSGRALVFRDSRQFGRVRFHHGKTPPNWWSEIIPEIVSAQFNRKFFEGFLTRHGKASIKAVLLLQSGFSGIGNWMADEILWRAKVPPAKRTGELSARERARILRQTRFVARESLRIMSRDLSDPPRGWLIHERWRASGKCPRDGMTLRRARIGGRTTAWCPKCQQVRRSARGRGIPRKLKVRGGIPQLRSG
jgi:formamidopyrimidine-DNA glycosylase